MSILNAEHVCPVELAGGLDNRIRRWLQDPQKILKPYIKPGMTVLDRPKMFLSRMVVLH